MRKLKTLLLTLPLSAAIPLTTLSVTALSPMSYAEAISARVGEPLQQAQQLAASGKWSDAMAKVKQAAALPNKTPAEENNVNEFMAYIALNSGDYTTAANAYEATLPAISNDKAALQKRLLTITQLHYRAKNYAKVNEFGQRYSKEFGNSLDIQQLLAQSAYLQKNYALAETSSMALIQQAQKSDQKVQEDWLKLLLSSQQEQGKNTEASATLEQLLRDYPSQAYWQDMFSRLRHTPLNEQQTLETLRLKQRVGAFLPNDYIDFSELALSQNLPAEAKTTLEQGISKGILGKEPNSAREQRLLKLATQHNNEDLASLAALEKAAAARVDGEADSRLGDMYVSQGNYGSALKSLQQALKKGKLKDADATLLHLGIAKFGLGQKAAAAAHFNSLSNHARYGQIARLWAIYSAS